MQKQFLVSVLVLAVLGSLAIPAHAASKGSLVVNVNGISRAVGQVCLNVFARNQGFPSDTKLAVKSQCVKVEADAVTVTFTNLPAGTYGVTAIHDANNDGTFNRNGLGMPLEGYGFSQNPVIRFGPPKFGETAIIVAGPTTRTDLRLNYLLNR